MNASLEKELARVFGIGLSGAIVFLALGVFIPAALWLGVVSLIACPLIGAALTWRDSSTTNAVRWSIATATLGLLAAVIVGLLLRR
jgi:Na+/glutamate symporter